MKKNNGFTLIELLVVIAIIGVLASVVLAALTSARSKGTDTAVKSNLANTRAQAELFYDGNSNSYAGACGTAATASGVKSINTMVLAAGQATGIASVNNTLATAGTYNTATCHDSAAAWAAEAPITGSASGTPKMWCVDSTGASKQEAANLAANATVCA